MWQLEENKPQTRARTTLVRFASKFDGIASHQRILSRQKSGLPSDWLTYWLTDFIAGWCGEARRLSSYSLLNRKGNPHGWLRSCRASYNELPSRVNWFDFNICTWNSIFTLSNSLAQTFGWLQTAAASPAGIASCICISYSPTNRCLQNVNYQGHVKW